MTSTQQRILIVGPNRVGDLVMATPTFRALRAHFSHAHVALMVRRFLSPLVQPSPWFDRVIPGCGHGDGLISMTDAVVRLRRERFDLAILFPNSFRSALLARLGGCGKVIGYNRDGRGWLLTEKVTAPMERDRFVPVPTIGYYLELAGRLGADVTDRRMELFVDDADRISAERVLEEAGLTGARPLALISPGASFGPSKCWPTDRFARTADLLAEKLGAAVTLICAPGEVEIARAVGRQAEHELNILGDGTLALGTLKAVIELADVLITNDTGARHIAAALGTPVVTIFGPTDPVWARIDYEKEIIVRVDVPCGPCQLSECPTDHRCMTEIAPERVADAVEELLTGLDLT